MFPSQPAPLLLEMSVSEQPGLSREENTNSEQTIKKFTQTTFSRLFSEFFAHKKEAWFSDFFI